MAEPRTIPTSAPSDIGLDRQELYARGLERIQRLAGDTWTDHNTHDPGITVLELATYALTDLTYRASLPVRDLLRQVTFWTAAKVLPNEPVTVTDYRRIVVDTEGVKNAWVRAERLPCFADPGTGVVTLRDPGRPGVRPIAVGGLYRILVEYADHVTTDEKRNAVRADVLSRLHRHRALCDDFLDVTGVETQNFLLCAEIDLLPGADTTAVHSAVLQQTRDYLAPGIDRYDLAQIRRRTRDDGSPYTIPEIFEGPLLEHGFLDGEELESSELRRQIRLSDIISRIMDIDGVVAVRDAVISPEVAAGAHAIPVANRWVVDVAPGKVPGLNAESSRLVYYKRGMPIVPPARDGESAAARAEVRRTEDVPVPAGRERDVAAYHSFQHHFPALYGLDEDSAAASDDGRAAILCRQFKSFLLFFDQVMANFCAQLANVHELFSTSPASRTTYFSQAVSRLPGVRDAYAAVTDETLRERLGSIAEGDDVRTDRRNRFLDHRMALVAERFQDYASIMHAAFGATTDSLIADKCAFLEQCTQIGAERGRGYDHTRSDAAGLWDSANVSGFERRCASLLGISHAQRGSVDTIELGADARSTVVSAGSFGFALVDPISHRQLLTEARTSASPAEAQDRMRAAFEYGQWTTTYTREVRDDGGRSFTISDPKTREVLAKGPTLPDEAAVEAAIAEVRSYLRRHYSRERIFVIENILLRPEFEDDPSLHFCADRDCVDCGGDDPYSFRIHVLLPAYVGRFNDMDFRHFVETLVREELPAHIFPKICWVGAEAMPEFESAYRDWLEVRAGLAEDSRSERTKRLIRALTEVKSVYPSAKLTPCDAPETEPRFLLGRTVLGTKKEND